MLYDPRQPNPAADAAREVRDDIEAALRLLSRPRVNKASREEAIEHLRRAGLASDELARELREWRRFWDVTETPPTLGAGMDRRAHPR